MNVFTLLSKIVESSFDFEIWSNEDNVVYIAYDNSFIANDIETIVDVDKRGDYSVVFKANSDCYFEIAAIGCEYDDGDQNVFDVAERIRQDVESRGLLTEYHKLCEIAANQI